MRLGPLESGEGGITLGYCFTDINDLLERSRPTIYLVGARARFHIHRLSPPKMNTANTLGHNGIACPATSTCGRITSRANCAMAIRTNTILATRSPAICEFMLSSHLCDLSDSKRINQARSMFPAIASLVHRTKRSRFSPERGSTMLPA